MENDLREIAEYLNDIANEIEDGNLTEDDWCINKIGIDTEINHLRKIASEMSKYYT